ncbi:MAG: O-antigen ligase family protein [Hylemonella sp.]|uniref:O-antigen ligase family protein n=1 Tax=Hylemonella sp. TaxID=2066020 RepID=UPI00391A644A
MRQRLYFFAFLAYLAVLPIANTVALRNLLAVFLLGILVSTLLHKTWRGALNVTALKSPALIPLLLWALYLCLFPLWADQPQTAWENLRGQWGMSLLAWVLGFGGVLVLGRQGPGLWQLGLASAFLVGLHMFMSLLAWSGLLGSDVPADLPLKQMLSALKSVLDGGTPWAWQPFPWGFRGFDPMHGNLGYTANQATVLFMCCLLFAMLARRYAAAGWDGLAVIVCFMSVVIAYSRGAVLYGAGVVALAILVFYLRLFWRVGAVKAGLRRDQLAPVLAVWAVLLLAALFSFSKDERWHQMGDKIRIAYMIEDPVSFLCEGPDEALLGGIRTRMADRDPVYVAALIDGLKGDGARITLMRAGWLLVQAQPLGLDGSRLAYKKLIESTCGHAPAMVYEHAHQGWLDTALALGWVGALLLLALLLGFACYGWRHMLHPDAGPWALALLLLVVFWGLRGFADSIYREHLLQMQAVLMAFVCARVAIESRGAPSVEGRAI